jgi:hypothetical protein
MFADAAAIIREQALELVEHGCRYIQIDAPELATVVDPEQARFFADLGIEPERIYLLATGVTGLQSLGAKFYVEQLFYGGSLLLALAASAVVERRRAARVT